MVEEDTGGAGADGDSGFDVARLAETEDFAPGNAGEDGGVADAEDEDDIEEVAAEDGGDKDDEDEVGDGEEEVDDGHDDAIDFAPDVTGDEAGEHAESTGDEDAEEANGEGDAGAVDDAAEHILAEVVGAEGVFPTATFLPSGWLFGHAQILVEGVVGGDDRGKDGDEGDEDEEDEAEQTSQVTSDEAPAASASFLLIAKFDLWWRQRHGGYSP